MKEQLIKSLLLAGALGVASVGAYEAVQAIDSAMTPTYEPGGEAAPTPTETVIWQPRTDWKRVAGQSATITVEGKPTPIVEKTDKGYQFHIEK